jgi:hypothetical protein
MFNQLIGVRAVAGLTKEIIEYFMKRFAFGEVSKGLSGQDVFDYLFRVLVQIRLVKSVYKPQVLSCKSYALQRRTNQKSLRTFGSIS